MDSKEEPWIFSLPDLLEFPEGSLPSPYGLMVPVRRLPPGLRLIAVGWLDGPIEFPTGATHPDVVFKLLGLGDAFLIDEGTAGYHSCYYCEPEVFATAGGRSLGARRRPWDERPHSPRSKGHNLVRRDDVVYMCPALLPHYIIAHGYRPPDVFQSAVIHGTFLADSDLVHTGEDFVEVALRQSLAAAEAAGDSERADGCRARIDARREELRLAGRTSGFRDRHTGVWRDHQGRVAPPPGPSPEEPRPQPPPSPFAHVLLEQRDSGATWSRILRLLARLRERWRG